MMRQLSPLATSGACDDNLTWTQHPKPTSGSCECDTAGPDAPTGLHPPPLISLMSAEGSEFLSLSPHLGHGTQNAHSPGASGVQ